MPYADVDWTSKKSPVQVRGMSDPLIEIRRVHHSKAPKPGVPWKRLEPGGTRDEDDQMVLRAARLAEFLLRQERSTPSGRVVPRIVSIHVPVEPGHPFVLQDSEQNLVSWGQGAGDEKPGDPSSEARWKMLLDWVERHGPLNAKYPNYLDFTRTEAVLIEGKPPKKP